MSPFRHALTLVLIVAVTGVTVGVRAAELTFNLRIENGRVPENMRLIRVKQGDRVKLKWTADRRLQLHLHGYDIEKQIVPGAATDLTFIANRTGRFSVNLHGSQDAGAHGREEAIVYIEVLPP